MRAPEICALQIHAKVPAQQSVRKGCNLSFVSVTIAGLAVNPHLSDFRRVNDHEPI